MSTKTLNRRALKSATYVHIIWGDAASSGTYVPSTTASCPTSGSIWRMTTRGCRLTTMRIKELKNCFVSQKKMVVLSTQRKWKIIKSKLILNCNRQRLAIAKLFIILVHAGIHERMCFPPNISHTLCLLTSMFQKHTQPLHCFTHAYEKHRKTPRCLVICFHVRKLCVHVLYKPSLCGRRHP